MYLKRILFFFFSILFLIFAFKGWLGAIRLIILILRSFNRENTLILVFAFLNFSLRKTTTSSKAGGRLRRNPCLSSLLESMGQTLPLPARRVVVPTEVYGVGAAHAFV